MKEGLKTIACVASLVLVFGCGGGNDKILPQKIAITESVYASITIQPDSLYEAYAIVAGILDQNLVEEGDLVSKGQPILQIINSSPKLGTENARLAYELAKENYNGASAILKEIQDDIKSASLRFKNDSMNFFRQKNLWDKKIGSKAEYDNKKLSYEVSKNNLNTLKAKYKRTKNELSTKLKQAENDYRTSQITTEDFTVTSKIEGKVYALNKNPGEIVRPANLKRADHPATMALTCISVKEVGNARRPINWKLLTAHKIENYQDALLMVQWYGARWYIEQFFRILKKQGFGIEEAQLESGWAIRKLVLMQMSAILKILQMNIAYSQSEGGQPIEEVFKDQGIEALTLMNAKLQGRTQKLRNHNDPKYTKWAAWVIGRLGGWKGYDSLGPPGVITLKRGLDRLSYLIEGMNLVKDVGTR